MKLTKRQLKQIIKEALVSQDYPDALDRVPMSAAALKEAIQGLHAAKRQLEEADAWPVVAQAIAESVELLQDEWAKAEGDYSPEYDSYHGGRDGH